MHAAGHGGLVTRAPLSHASQFCSSKAKRAERLARLKKGKERKLPPCTICSVIDRVEHERGIGKSDLFSCPRYFVVNLFIVDIADADKA